jgi:superfamily II DNA or RNA helicase/HKD family nuclease
VRVLDPPVPIGAGHLIVATTRHVADYFEASAEEQAALWRVVADLRRRLEHAAEASGYLVAFEIGETELSHAHVHLIPRASPGARLGPTSLAASTLFDGPARPLERPLLHDLSTGTQIDIAVAFVFRLGVERIYAPLAECLERGGQVRVLTGDYGDSTDPAALRRLLDLKTVDATRVRLRVFETAQANAAFHPKAYLISSDGAGAVAYVGSSNLSISALVEGVEWNLRITDGSGIAQTRRAFDAIFEAPATRELDDAWIDAYEQRRLLAPRPPAEAIEPIEPPAPPPAPHEIQLEALAALKATRKAGNRAGLVVLATGLGKTWLSAFDSIDFPRVLFVAHRDEILQQALRTFRAIRPNDRLGMFTGDEKDHDAKVLFASIQTLQRRDHLAKFDPQAFDYIIVDEFHHAAAATYRRIIRHFEPQFLLGLTATPERSDGGDLLALCDENLVFRCNVGDGVARGRLCPFHYYGIPDLVDYSNIPWRSSKFDEEELTRRVATQARAANALEQWRKLGGGRTLGFCVSQRHADFMAKYFAEAGVVSAAVHSGPSSAPRSESLARLERGELDVLFAVDMFNEGLDIRGIDTVLMLRPTESKILWLQQIGRGLRKSPGKQQLRIIDYIGNHKIFINKPLALLSLFGIDARPREVAYKLRARDFELPPGCEVTYSLEAIEILERLFPPTPRGDAIREWYEDHLERTGLRPTALQAFQSDYNPRATRAEYGGWLAFVEQMGGLDDAHREALRAGRAFLEELEQMPMPHSHEMLVLDAMLDLDALPGRTSIDALAAELGRLARRSAALRDDLGDVVDDPKATKQLLEKDALAAWAKRSDPLGRPYFVRARGAFATGDGLSTREPAALRDLIEELVDWRIARYLHEHHGGVRFRVIRNASGKPILRIDRSKRDLPEGWADVLIDGRTYEANFVKEFVNVVREKGGQANAMPEIMTRWFGVDAGARGTGHSVAHDAAADGGYRWTPVATAEGRVLLGDDGRPIDARYLAEEDESGQPTLVLMSRGGGRNDAYNEGLTLLLRRLAEHGLAIDRIAVESRETAALPLADRTVVVEKHSYPLRPAATADFDELRKRIGRGIAAIARAPGARGGGNANKRIRIWVAGVRGVDDLERVIPAPSTRS